MSSESIKLNFLNNTIIARPEEIEEKIFYYKNRPLDIKLPESLKSSKNIPSIYNSQKARTFKEFIENFSKDKLDYKAITTKIGDSYTSLTYGEVQEQAKALGNSLRLMGVKKGDKIGILSENRNEWVITYLSVTSIGSIIVPYDINMLSNELKPVINASDADIIITSAFFIDKILEIKSELINIKKIICFDQHQKIYDDINNNSEDQRIDNASSNDEIKKIEEKESDKTILFQDYEFIFYYSLLNIGKLLFKKGIDEYSTIDVKPDDTCALVHINGARFAMLTQDGIMSNTHLCTNRASASGVFTLPGEVWLETLPLHHTYPVVGGFLSPFYTYGESILLTNYRMKELVDIIIETKAEYIWTVPLILELIYKELKKSKKKMESVSLFVSGGARFDEKVARGLHDMGYIVLQGYGLTEFSPVAAANDPTMNRINSIGKILNNMEAMIDNPDDNGNGELLVKGQSMMKGYYKMPEETKKVIDKDGWLHTGDIACMDKDGFIFITGRLKNIIVIKGGKNLFPEKIEQKLKESVYISDAVIVPAFDYKIGEYPYAFIQPDWSEINQLERESNTRFSDIEINNLIQQEINKICSTMAGYNTINSFEIYKNNKKEQITSQRLGRFIFNDQEIENAPDNSVCCSKYSDNAGSNCECKKGSETEETQKEQVARYLAKKTAELLNIPKSEFDTSKDFTDCLESATLLELCREVNIKYNIGEKPNVFFDYENIDSFSDYLLKKYGEKLLGNSIATSGNMDQTISDKIFENANEERQLEINMDISEISVRRAVSKEDIEKVYQVRWDGYKKYFNNINELKDECDLAPNSVLLLATDVHDNPIGTMRILDRSLGEIELDSFLNVDNILHVNERPCAEATRLSVPLCRDSFSIKFALMKAFICYCLDNNIQTMMISALPVLGKSYEELLFKDVGEAGIYYHEQLGGKEHRSYKLDAPSIKALYEKVGHPLYSLFFFEKHPNINYK